MYFIDELKVHRHCRQVREGVQYPGKITSVQCMLSLSNRNFIKISHMTKNSVLPEYVL